MNHKEFIHYFKQIFLEKLEKGISPSFKELEQEMIISLNLDQDMAKSHFLECKKWFESLIGLRPLHDTTELSELNEIILHSYHFCQVYTHNKTWNLSPFISNFDFDIWIQMLAIESQVEWNYKKPFSSFYYRFNEDMFRITLIHSSSLFQQSHKCFIRKVKGPDIQFGDFSLQRDHVFLLKSLIKNKKNILIAGATNSGKTTLLSLLLKESSPNEHLITLEDTKEIIVDHNNQSSFLSQNIDGKTLKDYCEYSLRMKPDRLVLGELRGKEVIPFLLSMNTGHQGLLTTIHADSAVKALDRLAVLFLLYHQSSNLSFQTVMKLICKNINYVIFLKNKEVKEIIHVVGEEDGLPIYDLLLEQNI